MIFERVLPSRYAVSPAVVYGRFDLDAILLGVVHNSYLDLNGNFVPEFFQYHSKRMGRFFGFEYAKSLKRLESDGLIHRSRGYTPGTRCKTIWLTPETFDSPLTIIELSRRRKVPWYLVPGSGIAPKSKLETKLAACLRSVSFDRPACKRWDSKLIWKLANDCYHFTRDLHGRVHTSATQLSQACRASMLIDGRPTVEVDVSCCQPAILGSIVAAETEAPDAKRFAALASAGELYGILFSAANDIGFRRNQFWPAWVKEYANDTGPISIQDVKKQIVRYVFTRPEKMNAYAISGTFSAIFPTVDRFLREVKSGDHRVLAHRLQRIESKAMIDGAARALLKLTKLVTIHDSIRLPAEFAEIAAAEIRAAFAKIGVSVRTGTK